MRAKLVAMLVALAVGTPGAVAADDRVTDARRRESAVREEMSALLAQYRDAALAADEAAADILAHRLRVETARAAERDSRRAFSRRIVAAYIDGGKGEVEVILGSREVADLQAWLPLARSSVQVASEEAGKHRERRSALASEVTRLNEQQRDRLKTERTLELVRTAIERRLAAARAQVKSAEAAARVRSFLERYENLRRVVDGEIARRRRLRGERAFAAAMPFLGPRPSCDAPAGLRATGTALTGEASWYGPGFAGNGTASGAVFDPRRYTIAHKTLPFGLFLLVRLGDRCVMTFLNDRGPYVGDRILDLSEASAQVVGLTGVHTVNATAYARG